MNSDFVTQVKNTLVTHKKKLWSIIIFVAFLAAFSVGVHAMFRVNGVVTGADNTSITVANFFRTQTVDLTGAPINTLNIKVGDKVKIEKNLQGNVLSIRVNTTKNGEHEHQGKHDRI